MSTSLHQSVATTIIDDELLLLLQTVVMIILSMRHYSIEPTRSSAIAAWRYTFGGGFSLIDSRMYLHTRMHTYALAAATAAPIAMSCTATIIIASPLLARSNLTHHYPSSACRSMTGSAHLSDARSQYFAWIVNNENSNVATIFSMFTANIRLSSTATTSGLSPEKPVPIVAYV